MLKGGGSGGGGQARESQSRNFIVCVGVVTSIVLFYVATHRTVGWGRLLRPVRHSPPHFNETVFRQFSHSSCTGLMQPNGKSAAPAPVTVPGHVPLVVLMFSCANSACRERRTWQRASACGVYRAQSEFASCHRPASASVSSQAGSDDESDPAHATERRTISAASDRVLFRFVIGIPNVLYLHRTAAGSGGSGGAPNAGATPALSEADAEALRVAESQWADAQSEAREFGDVLLIDTAPDTHEQMFTKVLAAFRWAESVSIDGRPLTYDYLLKTDDDSFLRLPFLLDELNRIAERAVTATANRDASDDATHPSEWPLSGDDTGSWSRLKDLNDRQNDRIDRRTQRIKQSGASPAGSSASTADPVLLGRFWRSHFTATNRYEWWYPTGGGYVLSRGLVDTVLRSDARAHFRPNLPEDLAVGMAVFPYVHRPRDDTRIHQWPTQPPHDPLTPRSYIIHYANTAQRVLWLLNYFHTIDAPLHRTGGGGGGGGSTDRASPSTASIGVGGGVNTPLLGDFGVVTDADLEAAATNAASLRAGVDPRCERVRTLTDSRGAPIDCD